jgi:O-antigen ligase
MPNTEIKDSTFKLYLFCIAATTIYFNIQFIDPFNSAKLIVLNLTSFWFIGHIIYSIKKTPIKIRSFDLTVLIVCISFIIALSISFVFTDNLKIAFIGDSQRRNGWLAYFCLVVILLFSYKFTDFRRALAVIKISILVNLILSFYGVLQISGNDFVNWLNPYNAMFSTLGNPNFASALLSVLSIISIGSLFLKSLPVYFKFIAMLAISMAIFDIIQSDSRQGILALICGFLFYASFAKYKSEKVKNIYIQLFALIILIIGILGMLQKGPLAHLLYKDSVTVRGYYWEAGLKMFREYFFTGVGLDSYGFYFKEFREPGYSLKYGFDITSSNAHNTYIQMFATGGFFVGLTYLCILALVFFQGLKLVNSTWGDQHKIVLILLSSWVGYQAQSFISIDNIGISVWNWILGGTILGLTYFKINENSNQFEKKVQHKSNKRVQINLVQIFLSTIFIIPALVISTLIFNFERDSYNIRSIIQSNLSEKTQLILNLNRNILNNPLADPFYQYQGAIALYDLGLYEESNQQILALYKKDPRNLDYLRALSLYAEQRKDFRSAISYRLKISNLDPWNAKNYLKLGELYKSEGDFLNMNTMLEKILGFANGTEEALKAQENLVVSDS